MALINCPECNKDVSEKASACPNCGFEVAKYIEKQKKIQQIQIEAKKEAYLYVKKKQQEEKERIKAKMQAEINNKNNIYSQAMHMFKSHSSVDVENAEKLFLSITGYKDADTYYKQCKIRIEELKVIEKLRIKRRKKIFTIIATLLSVIIILLFANFKIVPKIKYIDANKLLENGHYLEAKEIFKSIKYIDCTTEIENCNFEELYQKAHKLYRNQNYEDAIIMYKKILEYKDSSNMIEICNKEISNKIYQEAMNLFNKQKYNVAIKEFKKIENYKDSLNMLAYSYYLLAEQLYNNNDYEGALIKIGVLNTSYNLSEELEAKKEALYTKVKNTMTQIQNAVNEEEYQLALTEFSNMNYSSAWNSINIVSNYEGNTERVISLKKKLIKKGLYNSKVGDIIEFGKEKWIVLEKENNKLCIITEKDFGKMSYNDAQNWLLDFYNTNFEEWEKAIICNTDFTNEYTFLLSVEEAKKYIVNDPDIIKKVYANKYPSTLKFWLGDIADSKNAYHMKIYKFSDKYVCQILTEKMSSNQSLFIDIVVHPAMWINVSD